MKKSVKLYLLFSFLISYISFGIIIFSGIVFGDIFKSPLYLHLFIIGCLGPFISSLIIYSINKEEFGGVKELFNSLKIVKSKAAIYS